MVISCHFRPLHYSQPYLIVYCIHKSRPFWTRRVIVTKNRTITWWPQTSFLKRYNKATKANITVKIGKYKDALTVDIIKSICVFLSTVSLYGLAFLQLNNLLFMRNQSIACSKTITKCNGSWQLFCKQLFHKVYSITLVTHSCGFVIFIVHT